MQETIDESKSQSPEFQSANLKLGKGTPKTSWAQK